MLYFYNLVKLAGIGPSYIYIVYTTKPVQQLVKLSCDLEQVCVQTQSRDVPYPYQRSL